MAILKFIGTVGTNKVGSDCEFEFEVDEEKLPTGKQARADYLDEVALEALWESGQFEWGYRPVRSPDMAAKLEWQGTRLVLGDWALAHVARINDLGQWAYVVDTRQAHISPEYNERADAQQDCESDVRRLLREAGCEVEP